MKSLLTVGGLALALVGSAPMAQAQDEGAAAFHATTLALSAEGEVHAKPDLAVINLGVQTEAATAGEALAHNRTEMTATLAALHGQGVSDADIQTSNLSLSPQYFFDAKEPRKLTGYQASNQVTVKLRDMKRVGAVVDALVAAGANQINGIGFQLADRTPVENAARAAAVKALQVKAELYAQASGYRLQRLVRLSEGEGVFPPQGVPMYARVAMQSATPVEAGEMTVRVSVSGVYELSR